MIKGLYFRLPPCLLLNSTLTGKVSLDRVGKFLRETELLDNYSEETYTEIDASFTPEDNESTIGFNDAVFAWSKDVDDGTQTPSSRSYKLKAPGRVEFKPNALNLIVGPTYVVLA